MAMPAKTAAVTGTRVKEFMTPDIPLAAIDPN
jgi:hypothetical protein